MRRCRERAQCGSLFLVLALLASRAVAAPASCQLREPPAVTGEVTQEAELLLVFPRAKDMGAEFTGCQSIWGRTKDATRLIGRLEYAKGAFVAVHDGAKRIQCSYREGELEPGTQSNCPQSQPRPISSVPHGCLSKARPPTETPATPPPECETYE